MSNSTTPSRRQLITQAGAILAAASATTGSSALLAQGRPSDDEVFWDLTSKQFMLAPGTIYLRAGTTGPMPRPVFDAEVRYQRMLAETPSVRSEFENVINSSIRKKAALFIGADLEETALTLNTTEALNIVAHGLPLKAGDQVIQTDQEHPSMLESWRMRSKRDGVEITQVKLPTPLSDPAAFLNSIDRAITNRTKLIAVPHIPNPTGLVMPVKEICALARSKNILTVLDGAHCVGQMKLNMKELGCDFYATSAHKWLNSPIGNGIFYVRRELQDRLWPLSADSNWDTFGDARKYTTVGCRAFATKMALGDAIDFANAIGMEKIEARNRELMTYFRRKVSSLPAIESFVPDGMHCGQSAFGFRIENPQKLGPALLEKYGIVSAGVGRGPTGGVGAHMRVDLAYFVTKSQVDKTIGALDELTRKRSA